LRRSDEARIGGDPVSDGLCHLPIFHGERPVINRLAPAPLEWLATLRICGGA